MVPTLDLLLLLKETCSRIGADASLDMLARRAGWSPYYLHRSFRSIVGETPKGFMTRIRLERAAARLIASDQSVLTIAVGSGYSSNEVFARAFRRQFGCSPSEYRERGLPGSSQHDRVRHREVVEGAGPCVGLYHINPNGSKDSATMAELTISQETVTEQPILFIRDKMTRAGIQPFLAESFGALFGHGSTAGLAIAGYPTARYISAGPGLLTVDAVLPLSAEAPAEGRMEPGTLQGGEVARAIHLGSYDELPESYGRIERWMDENGREPAGAPWEVYITDPAQEADPAKWRTDIYWPMR